VRTNAGWYAPVKKTQQIFILMIAILYILQIFTSISISSFVYQSTKANNSATGSFILPYLTYQLSAWAGGGIYASGSDTQIQEMYMSTASMAFPEAGFAGGYGGPTDPYAGWCNGANTTTTKIPQPITYSNAIIDFQMPFFIQEPLDGYGSECPVWSQEVVAQYPDLFTYNQTGAKISNFVTQGDYVRVDDLNFSHQFYSDLLNIYINFKNLNPNLINLWYGIRISSIGADGGAYGGKLDSPSLPNYMWGANSILDFAQSPLCKLPVNCETLAGYARNNSIAQAVQLIKNSGQAGIDQYHTFVNVEFLLGISYALYLMQSNGYINHQFVLAPAYSIWIPTSEYPYPYNTTYFRSLNLLQRYEIGAGAYTENGNAPTSSSVSSDLAICKNNAPYGNLGGFLASTVTYPNYMYRYVQNMMYYEAACAATSIMEPGNLDYSPSSPYWSILTGYGTLLNRMRNLGNYQILVSISASDPTTSVTMIKTGGEALAWFYTNSTTGDNAELTVSASQLGIDTPWVAISVLNWQVVGSGTGDTININVRVPAQSWNPIYIVPEVPNLQLLYSNLLMTSYSINSSLATYVFSGPHALSGWAIMHVWSKPVSVAASNTGQIQEYISLQALNNTYVGMHWNGNSWQNLTQTGWYYDPVNQLLYVHFVGDRKVILSVMSTTSTQSGSLNISMPQTSVSIMQGTNSTLMFNVYSTNIASQLVTLTSSQVPAGVYVKISPYASYTNFSSTLLISVSNTTQPGSYYLILEANSSTLFTSVIITLSVIAAQPTGQGSSGNGGSASNQSGSNTGQSDNNTGQLSSKLYTLTILSGPVGFGSTSPDTGTYQLTAGTSVNITALPVKGWGLGSWFVNGNYAGNGSSLTIKMLSDTTVVALFTELTSSLPNGTVSISTDIANTTAMVDGKKYVLPVSFSWPIGTIHNISVDPLIQLSDNEQILFSNWTGAVNSNSNSISVNVQGDSFVLANHVIKYRVELKFVDSIGTPVKPDLAELSYNQGSLRLNSSFIFWAPAGIPFTFIGVKWDGTGINALNNSNTFIIMAPGSITIKLNIHPQAFKVQDIFGEPIAGAEVVVQLPNGTKIQEITNSSGLAYFPQLPPQGYQVIVSYIGSTLTLYPDQDPSGIQYVTFALSYPVIGAIVAVMASLGLSLSFNKIKKIISPSLKRQKQEIADQKAS